MRSFCHFSRLCYHTLPMAEEPQVSVPTEEPRHCPACGSRVAAKATTCLICGTYLTQGAVAAEPVRRGLPGWARPLIVVALALAILAAGGFGLYAMLTAEPEQTTPTASPTHTATATPTATPTQTPMPTSTPTSIPPLVHQVQEGETLLAIAVTYDTTVEEIQALNPDVDTELIQVGQLLLIPVPTPTPGPTNTPVPGVPTPTPPETVMHVVMPGETLLSIAGKYGVSLTLIRTANDLPPDDDTIRVNQSLIIPLGTPLPSPTPTVDPNATPTPLPPYPPPPLLSPPDGATTVGPGAPVLQWAAVSVLRGDEWYELTLLPDVRHPQLPGGVPATIAHTRATAWRVPQELLPAAGSEGGKTVREFRWQVQVVREVRDAAGEVTYEEAGAPSQARTFTWLASATPTPPSTSTPSPASTPAP